MLFMFANIPILCALNKGNSLSLSITFKALDHDLFTLRKISELTKSVIKASLEFSALLEFLHCDFYHQRVLNQYEYLFIFYLIILWIAYHQLFTNFLRTGNVWSAQKCLLTFGLFHNPQEKYFTILQVSLIWCYCIATYCCRNLKLLQLVLSWLTNSFYCITQIILSHN